MSSPKVLVVDDDEIVRSTLSSVLTENGFHATLAANVPEALKYLTTDDFHVLLSDMHMPQAGDGLTVISAMRHAHPKAVTILLSSSPEMNSVADILVRQPDEILIKPVDPSVLVDVINDRLIKGPSPLRVVESVATILERTSESTISHWYERVQGEADLMAVPLSYELRCGHLPLMIHDLINRLHSTAPLGGKELRSEAAARHGVDRRKQGYSAAMMVEESRMLQVSLFETLQNNLATIDFSVVLIGVMTIADEVDFQLSQAMEGYAGESAVDSLPA
jgi:CheY-like chemotaxis protein